MCSPHSFTCGKPLNRSIALVLTMQLLFIPAPVVSASALGHAVRVSGAATAGIRDGILSWLMSSNALDSRGVKPPPPEQRSDKLNRLVRLQINPKGAVQLQERQSMIFTAIPFDREGSAI